MHASKYAYINMLLSHGQSQRRTPHGVNAVHVEILIITHDAYDLIDIPQLGGT